ncbi:MAG: hypothetical protein ACETWM_06500 [Candidatus Lokiarchaeia archaeon]
MILSDDLDIQLAWKVICAIVVLVGIVAVAIFVYFVLSSIGDSFVLPLFSSKIFVLLRVSDFVVESKIFGFTLFKTVYTGGIVMLLFLMFGWFIFIMLGAYDMLIIRLAKEGDIWTGVFGWRNSDRYKSFGEAKVRIKTIIRQGTKDEKRAIKVFIICFLIAYFAFMVPVLGFSGFLPLSFLEETVYGPVYIYALTIFGFFYFYGYLEMWDTIR